jgi:hypothetical protein
MEQMEIIFLNHHEDIYEKVYAMMNETNPNQFQFVETPYRIITKSWSALSSFFFNYCCTLFFNYLQSKDENMKKTAFY